MHISLDTYGGNGHTAEYPMIRRSQIVETINTSEETQDVHALTLGRAITGIQAVARVMQ